MLARIAAFELRYQLRSPLFVVACTIFFLLTFGAVTIDQIQIGGQGNVNVNSPYAILQTVGVMTVFALFVVVAFVANVVVRDDETGFAPIIRTTRLSKADYLLGRLAGATLVAFLVVSAIPLAMLAGSLMPWLDPEKVGPLRLGDYGYALFFFALPTLLVMAAGFFAVATATRSMMATYVAAVAFLVGFFVARGLLRDPQWDAIVALLDPFGLSALTLATKYWTATERNTQLPQLAGPLLHNRMLWLGVSFGLVALAYTLFRFEARGARIERAARRSGRADTPPPARPSLTDARSGAGTAPATSGWRQLLALTRFDLAFVFRSPAFFVLLAIGVLNSLGGLVFATSAYGSEIFPVTRVMITTLQGSFTIIPLIIAIFYAGELVWRDRQQRVHEIVDATPAPDWAFVAPKIVAIVLVLSATLAASVLTAIVVQAFKGYTQFEFGNYLLWYVAPNLVDFTILAVLAVFSQALVPHKFYGWAFMLLYVVATITLSNLGFEHHLYTYGSTPTVPLSDMNGTGRFWVGQAWLQVYWGAFALILAVASYALWRRGTEARLAPRLRRLPLRLAGPAGAIAGVAALVGIGSGAWIFYNMNVLNEYVPAPLAEKRQADYERELLAYEQVPQPRVTDVTLAVELFPHAARATTRGSYMVENRTDKPLPEVHLRWMQRLKMDELKVEGGTLARDYEQFAYRIYRFEQPMQPGERRTIEFVTRLEERGFPARRPLTRIVSNGTFINSFEIAPGLGMGRDQLLVDRAKRRKQGLDPDMRMPKLEDDAASANHYLRPDADWVHADITVVTEADQVPVAPGNRIYEFERGGRRTARFRTEAPIHFFFSVQSARYARRSEVVQTPAGDVDLVVYYHPGHPYNVDRMLNSMRMSIELFGREFSPYQFKQARILEFPAYADFAQAFAGTMPYSEGIGFIVNHKDPEKIDLVTYVTAHEVAHQWWAHQVVGANKQGSTMLSETFAQYSALLIMERMYGREQVRRFLKYELDRYLRSRGGEVIEELPLVRVENQPYIHYQKGTLVMYWLREVVGEDTVNRALRRLIEAHAFKAAPYPSAADFVRILREEAGAQHDALITDLFERITLVDAKVTAARAIRRDDGRYDAQITVEARKLYADGKGKETEAPLDEPFDIGVFTAEPGKKDFSASSVLYFERRPIRTGTQTLTVTVDEPPRFAGVDPYNKRIDRNSEDNLRRFD
jgi:aminopeptidase N